MGPESHWSLLCFESGPTEEKTYSRHIIYSEKGVQEDAIPSHETASHVPFADSLNSHCLDKPLAHPSTTAI
jgi:hypothetical protein